MSNVFKGTDDNRIKGRTQGGSAASPPTSSAGPVTPRSVLDFKETPGRTVYACYNKQNAQVLTTGDVLIIDFNTKEYDTYSSVTTGAAWKFTAPSTKIYDVDCVVTLSTDADWAPGEMGYMYLYVNGVLKRMLDRFDNISSRGTLVGSTKVYLATNDYADVRVKSDAGGDVSVNVGSADLTWIAISD